MEYYSKGSYAHHLPVPGQWFWSVLLQPEEINRMQSVLSTALSRLNAFLDSELEQILCFDTAIDAERFCTEKSAIFLVMMFLDEIGTIPKIESAEMMFSASRSRRVSIVAIIQGFAQLEKNYGKEGAAIITDNCQDTVFGGFAPNSESVQILSKALGSQTV